MSAAVRDLLKSFDLLSETEKAGAVNEVLRRAPQTWSGNLSDEALVSLAHELFQRLDCEELEPGDHERREFG